ncbi:MAG: class I SAM-dependent rRNA methyltransferase, partial [Myxococcales bacterium]
YETDVLKTPKGLAGGELVRVVDQKSWFQGYAFYSSESKITLRLLTRDDEPCDRDFFLRRFAEAKRLREAIFPGVDVWRAVHGEADLLPGTVVDRYGDCLVVQLLTQGAEARKGMFVEILRELYRPKAILERSDARVRLLEGLEQRKGLLYGQDPGDIEYREGDVRLRTNLLGGQKTGAFLDQRENHVAAGLFARGRGLDCFSYAGGFALQLAKKCEQVTAVEISEEAGQLIRGNAELNGVANVDVVVQNAFDFLKAAVDREEKYDIIVLDPPAFAKNKGAIEAAERGYKEINLRALQLLSKGGVLVTASCSFHIDDDHFEEILWSAAVDARRSVQIVERRGAGRDHPVLMGARETRYLKCFVLRAA